MKSRRKPAAKRAASPQRAPAYEDLVRIVELLRATERFSEFRLRVGDIEVDVKRANGAAPPLAATPAAAPAAAGATAAAEAVDLHPDLVLVRAPMVGTFYRAPEPGAPPFVEPGARVEPDSVVGLVEVMKLFSSIAAGCAGVVAHVLATDGAAVEAGQPLVAIDPDA